MNQTFFICKSLFMHEYFLSLHTPMLSTIFLIVMMMGDLARRSLFLADLCLCMDVNSSDTLTQPYR